MDYGSRPQTVANLVLKFRQGTSNMIKLIVLGLLIINNYLLIPQIKKPQGQQNKQANTVNLVDYEIYSTLLNNLIPQQSSRSLYILDETIPSTADNFNVDEHYNFLRTKLPALSKEALINFNDINKTTNKLEDRFKLTINYAIFQNIEYKKNFFNPKKGWDYFYKRYPQASGIMKFSSIGYNKDKNQAIVYYSFTCDVECGSGSFILLTRSTSGWQINSQLQVWRSE